MADATESSAAPPAAPAAVVEKAAANEAVANEAVANELAADEGAANEATSTVSDSTASGGARGQSDDLEELLHHIRGIKFKNPTFGVKKVHAAVTQLGGKFSKVSIKRVKKHMKILGLTNAQLDADQQKAGVMKFYTVGSGAGADDAPAAAEADAPPSDTAEDGLTSSSWVVIPLDVPCDRSGKKPHQAVMSFNHDKGGTAHGRQGEIFKIQVAQDMPFGTPMLLYNENKNKKTFIHPSSSGYTDINQLIENSGTTGKLAAQGGMKAFFWGRHHRSLGRKFICINVAELAPAQPW